MTRTFFTADSHFAHMGILSERMNAPRPFASLGRVNGDARRARFDTTWIVNDYNTVI